MNQFIGAFEVRSKLSGHVYQCSFSHIWNAIATRHSDTIDAKFVVDGVGRIVGLAHTAFVAFRETSGRELTDREAASLPRNICGSGSKKKMSDRSTTCLTAKCCG